MRVPRASLGVLEFRSLVDRRRHERMRTHNRGQNPKHPHHTAQRRSFTPQHTERTPLHSTFLFCCFIFRVFIRSLHTNHGQLAHRSTSHSLLTDRARARTLAATQGSRTTSFSHTSGRSRDGCGFGAHTGRLCCTERLHCTPRGRDETNQRPGWTRLY